MSQWLLDANVLVALAAQTHSHHSLAENWFNAHSREGWATCAVTELAFLRLSLNPLLQLPPKNVAGARSMLEKLLAHRSHTYWRDPSHAIRTRHFQETFDHIATHNEVTDAYLVALAAHHRGWVATFDEAMAAKFHPVARLITWAM